MRKIFVSLLVLLSVSIAWGIPAIDSDLMPGSVPHPPEYGTASSPKSGPLFWSAKTSAPFARYWGAVGVRQDTIYLAGGRMSTAASTRTMLAYIPATDAWINPGQTETPNMPGARRAGATGQNDTLMFYVCGRDSASANTATTYIFNMRTKAWTTGANCPATAWSTAGAVVGDFFYRFGSESRGDTLYRYDITANTWSIYRPATRPAGRGWHTAASAQGKFYILGGSEATGYASDCWVYDPADSSWTQIASLPAARGYHNAVTVGDSLIMSIGGSADGTNYDNNVYIYHISSDTWTTENSMPTARGWAMIGAVQDRVYVLQGCTTGTVYMATNEEALFLNLAHDVGIQGIRAPGAQFSAAGPLAPVVSVKNYGQNPEDFQATFAAESLGVQVYSQSQNVTALAAGDTLQVSFPVWNATDGEVYDLTAYTVLSGDELPDNDTARATANTYSSEHKVMAELFTSSTCAPCVQANTALDGLYPTWSDSLVVMRYHMNWPSPGNDPFYADNPTENYSRRIYYGVNSVPDFWLNGTSYSYVGTTFEGNMAIERSILSPIGLALEGAYDSTANAGWVRATVTATGRFADASPNLRLRYAIIEDSVLYTGTNGMPMHDQVMRDLFPDTMGTAITINKGQTVADSLGFAYNPAWAYTVEKNCHAVAYLQDHTTRKIYQAERISFLSMLTGVEGQPTENKGLPLTYLLGAAYPNPTRGLAAIAYQMPRAGRVELAVYNIAGQRVRTLASGAKPAGYHTAKWDGRDQSGKRVSAGVYLYRLTTPEYSSTNKLTIVR